LIAYEMAASSLDAEAAAAGQQDKAGSGSYTTAATAHQIDTGASISMVIDEQTSNS
jgi:hypothetical protein